MHMITLRIVAKHSVALMLLGWAAAGYLGPAAAEENCGATIGRLEQPSFTVMPKKPSTFVALKKTIVKAKAKSRSIVSLKIRKKLTVAVHNKIKRPLVTKTVAHAKPVQKKQLQIASSRKTCRAGVLANGCVVPAQMLTTTSQANGGMMGGGAGGWH